MLARDKFSARSRRGKTPLATTSDGQRASLAAGITAIATEFAAVGAKLKIAIPLLEANRASLSRNVPAMATDFAAAGVDIDAFTSTAPEAHVVVLEIYFTRGLARAVTAAENNVLALDCTKFGFSRS
jgi:hypothetical protein